MNRFTAPVSRSLRTVLAGAKAASPRSFATEVDIEGVASRGPSFGLSEDQAAFQELARDFAVSVPAVVVPVGPLLTPERSRRPGG